MPPPPAALPRPLKPRSISRTAKPRASEYLEGSSPRHCVRPAHHDGHRIQLFRSTDGDVAVGHGDRALGVALVPGTRQDVDEDDRSPACCAA